MKQADIQAAAKALVSRRLDNRRTGPLAPQCRPETVDDALAVQQAVIGLTDGGVGGWKCALPIEIDGLKNVPVIAPIFAETLHQSSPCSMNREEGVYKIEPEIAFQFEKDLPSRKEPYTDREIIAALSGARLSLELIQSRYLDPDSISYLEHLSDCLFNQGLYLGPEITLEQALGASEIEFSLKIGSASEPVKISGKHPNIYPQIPLFWLVNFLRQQGETVEAGQWVITSSYAGVIEIPFDQPFTLAYEKLGEISLQFELN
jgi:2-keto-4-pentenoate hydratase